MYQIQWKFKFVGNFRKEMQMNGNKTTDNKQWVRYRMHSKHLNFRQKLILTSIPLSLWEKFKNSTNKMTKLDVIIFWNGLHGREATWALNLMSGGSSYVCSSSFQLFLCRKWRFLMFVSSQVSIPFHELVGEKSLEKRNLKPKREGEGMTRWWWKFDLPVKKMRCTQDMGLWLICRSRRWDAPKKTSLLWLCNWSLQCNWSLASLEARMVAELQHHKNDAHLRATRDPWWQNELNVNETVGMFE